MRTWILPLSAIIVAGCSASPSLEPRSFMGNTTLIEKGGDGKPVAFYLNPKADFTRYDRVLLVPVAIWKGENSHLSSVPRQDLQDLADLVFHTLGVELAKDYRITRSPDPGVLQVRVVLNEVQGSKIGLDTISGVIPRAVSVSGEKTVASAMHRFVRTASIEGEITDASSGEVLLRSIDRDIGAKAMVGDTSTWSGLEGAIDYWGQRFRQRLTDLRGQKKPRR